MTGKPGHLRIETLLFVLVFGMYAYFYQAGGWNQNTRFDLTRAMIERKSVDITPYHENTGDHAKRDGRYYCDKAPGISWLGLPAYAVAYYGFAPDPISRGFLSWSSYFVVLTSVSLISALGVVALYRMLAALNLSESRRLLLALAYAFGTMALPFSTILYGHQTAAALLIIPLAMLVRDRHELGDKRLGSGALVWVGVLLGMSVVVEYTAALGVIAICLYALWTRRPWWHVGWIVVGGAIPALLMAWYNHAAFGGPMVLPYEFSTQPHRSQGFFMGIGVPDPQALWHILLSPFRGLFFSAPWLLLALPGVVLLWRQGRDRALVTVSVVMCVLFVWLNASLVDWEGGKTFGPRYIIPAVPFLTLLCAGVLARDARRCAKASMATFVALGFVAFAMMFVATAVRPEVQVEFRNPWTDVLFPRFMEGAIATNTQHIDDYWPGDNRAAWNLGHVMGLSGRMSLLPVLGWIVLLSLTGLLLAVRANRQARPTGDVQPAQSS